MTDAEKGNTVKNWASPYEKKDFSGLRTYYRRLLKSFSRITKSLHKFTQKGKPNK